MNDATPLGAPRTWKSPKQDWLVGMITLALLAVLLMMTIWTVVAVRSQNAAVDALHTSSGRAECRTRIANEAEDEFRHRIGEALDAANRRESEQLRRVLDKINREEATQAKIERTCPAPLNTEDQGKTGSDSRSK